MYRIDGRSQMNFKQLSLSSPFLILVFLCIESGCLAGPSSPFTITDTGGNTVAFNCVPKRVVSLVPAATETLFALGAGDLIVGVTWNDTYPREANTKSIVGGFFDPSPELIEKLSPDVILFSPLQKKILQRFADSGIRMVQVSATTMDDGFRVIELLGQMTGRNEEAAALIRHIRHQLDIVSRKVAQIPQAKRKRVIRLMGSAAILTPGDGSFQNEFIRCAGGIPPSLGKPGAAVPVTKEEWMKFNPQVIYYCGSEWELLKDNFDKPGWKTVEAVKNAAYVRFPCDLTCRASIRMGDFVSWLAATLYPKDLASETTRLEPDRAVKSRPLTIDLPYVRSAQIIDSTVQDFPAQTLCIDFAAPMNCLSSLTGNASGITTVGNHYTSSPLSKMFHGLSIETLRKRACSIVKRKPSKCSFLYTGARMDSLSVQRRQYKEIIVYALATAGVMGNAMRAGVDEGILYEPGTINIIILTNMRLTPRARTRAIISATEAKSAALQDLDIQSSYSPCCQATGTGTDQLLVVEGRGESLDSSGGHTKLGELIAKAVHDAVKESISLQNGLVSGRSVLQRIKERKIDVYKLLAQCKRFNHQESFRIYLNLRQLLLNPVHAGFLESAFALGTAYDAGLVSNLQSFKQTCKRTCEKISGCTTDKLTQFVPEDCASKPVRMALDAFLNGIYLQRKGLSRTSPSDGVRAQKVGAR